MTSHKHEPAPTTARQVTDPVCGMSVATVETSLHLDHEGTRYWFCGSGCLRAFAADPALTARLGGVELMHAEGDDLPLPWTPQQRRQRVAWNSSNSSGM